jgi:predicted nucleic acid-binding protein
MTKEASKRLVCLDTQFIIWGIQKNARYNQMDMISKTERFLHWLDKNQFRVVIPSIVVAEVLQGIPDHKRDDFLSALRTSYVIVPFDALAAVHFARISMKIIIPDGGLTRTILKADRLIVATAAAKKVHCLYSNDSGVAKVAEGFVKVSEMPDIPTQADYLHLIEE